MPPFIASLLPLLASLGVDLGMRKFLPGFLGSKAVQAVAPGMARFLSKPLATEVMSGAGGLGTWMLAENAINSEGETAEIDTQKVNEAELLAMLSSFQNPQLQFLSMLQDQIDSGALPDVLNDAGYSTGAFV